MYPPTFNNIELPVYCRRVKRGVQCYYYCILRESRYVTRKHSDANFTFNLAFEKRKPKAQYYNIGIK